MSILTLTKKAFQTQDLRQFLDQLPFGKEVEGVVITDVPTILGYHEKFEIGMCYSVTFKVTDEDDTYQDWLGMEIEIGGELVKMDNTANKYVIRELRSSKIMITFFGGGKAKIYKRNV